MAHTSEPSGTRNQASFTKSVNFNVATTDTLIPIALPTGCVKYVVDAVWISNASHDLSTATVGVYGAVTGGAPEIAADQAITVTATAVNTLNNAQSLTLASLAPLTAVNYPNIYIRVGTPESAAAIADVTVQITYLG